MATMRPNEDPDHEFEMNQPTLFPLTLSISGAVVQKGVARWSMTTQEGTGIHAFGLRVIKVT